MTANPRKLFREVLGDTKRPLEAIKAEREGFGLSVDEAMAVCLEATGRVSTLSEQQAKLGPLLRLGSFARNAD